MIEIFWFWKVPNLSVANKILVLDYILWWQRTATGEFIVPWIPLWTHKKMALRADWEDSVHPGEYVLSISPSIPGSNVRHCCGRFIQNLPNTIARCPQLPSKELVYFSSPPSPRHTGPSAQVSGQLPMSGSQMHTVWCLYTDPGLWGQSEERTEWGKDREAHLSWVMGDLRLLEIRWGE